MVFFVMKIIHKNCMFWFGERLWKCRGKCPQSSVKLCKVNLALWRSKFPWSTTPAQSSCVKKRYPLFVLARQKISYHFHHLICQEKLRSSIIFVQKRRKRVLLFPEKVIFSHRSVFFCRTEKVKNWVFS